MTVLTNHTEATASHASSPDYYLWDEPETSVSIHLNYQTVERLQIEVLRGLDSNNHGGVEIGGILLGRREQSVGRVNTFIEEFVPVPCGYSGGSVYRLSDGEARKFERTLELCKSEATKSSSVLGFFRSHLRDDVFLSPDDLFIAQHFFTDPDNVFLLIKTLPSRGCTAAFFFWEDGRIQPECAYNEVPLSPVQIGPATCGVKQMVELPTPAPILPSVRRRPAVARAIGIGLALATAGGLGYWMKSGVLRGPAAGAVSLELHVERSLDHLSVIWNRNSAEVLAANQAVLSIRDGGHQEAFVLNRSQLRSGVATYKPDNQNVDFALELYRDRTPVAKDTLHVFVEVVPRAPSAESLPGPSEVHPPPGTPKAVSLQNPGSAVNLPSTTNAGLNNDQIRSRSTLLSSSIVKQLPESVGSPIPSNSERMEEPASGAPIDSLESQLPRRSVNLKIDGLSIPPIPESGASSAAKNDRPGFTQNQSPLPPQVASQPQSGITVEPRISTYVEPQVVRRVSPVITRDMRSKMKSDIEVAVTVLIDTNGDVTDVRVTSTKGALPRLVTSEALRAARLFRFQPARVNDHSVRSHMTLYFQFRL
jgi:TonB family protein